MSEDIAECRICFEQESIDDPFISPCMCKGTSKFVHKSCLNTWRHFNRGREPWNRCMECGEQYTIRFKYPLENTNIFKTSKNPAVIYFIQYMLALTIGSMIWLVDSHNNYLAIKMLNFNIKLKTPSLLTFVENDELAPQIFYFSYAIFIQSLFYYAYFFYIMNALIYRKNLYISKIKKTLALSIVFSLQFIIWYYLLVFNSYPVVYLNIISFFTMMEPFIYYNLVKKHNKIIKIMNEEQNEEEILSFEENPLLYGNNNIIRRDFELTNIIIDENYD